MQTPANRDPLPEELTACSSFLDEQIRLIDRWSSLL
jgi:uracil-DNA glycosylase